MSDLPIESNMQFETEEDRIFRKIQGMGVINVLGLQFQEAEETEGRYLQARLRLDDAILESAYQRFTDETGVSMTSDAKNLIRIALDAILSDPHPHWKATPEERVRIVGQYVSDMPQHLAKVAKDQEVSRQLTTFDLLYWAARDNHLMKLCIID